MSSRRGCKRASAAAAAGAPAPPADGEAIVRALGARGNQVEVERPDGSNALVLLPARFHKTLWIKRGGYLVVTAPPGVGPGAGAAGEVVAVLYRADVRALRAMPGVWPPEFEDAAGDGGPRPAPERASGSASGSEDSGLPPLAANPNRRRPTYETSSSEDEAEAEGGGGEGEGGA